MELALQTHRTEYNVSELQCDAGAPIPEPEKVWPQSPHLARTAALIHHSLKAEAIQFQQLMNSF